MATVRFIGSGDAFGSGGRLQACISVRTEEEHILLDCGATSLVGMRRVSIDPSSVDAVVLSHLHGDHFAGIPFLVLHGQFNRRERPLLVAGPPGTRDRVTQAMEVLFPGSSTVERRFALRFAELPERTPYELGPFTITPYVVSHASGAPAYALRVACEGKVLAYSGDTEWTESLVEAARDADLFICEAYFFEKTVKFHLPYATLREHQERLNCGRIVLTHMSEDMLAHEDVVAQLGAVDGLGIAL